MNERSSVPRRLRREVIQREQGGRVMGKTSTGRATVATLKMNSPRLIRIRLLFAELGLHPPRP